MSEHGVWRWCLIIVGAGIGVGLWHAGHPQAEARRSAMLAPACCVATIDLNVVLEALDERKVRETELQDFIRVRQAKLEEMKKKAQQAQDDLKILPEKSKDWIAKREEAASLALQLRAEEELAKALVEDKRKGLSLELFNKIKDGASKYAQKEGYALVISNDARAEIPEDAPEQQLQAALVARRVLHASDTADISQAVALQMNNEFKAR